MRQQDNGRRKMMDEMACERMGDWRRKGTVEMESDRVREREHEENGSMVKLVFWI